MRVARIFESKLQLHVHDMIHKKYEKPSIEKENIYMKKILLNYLLYNSIIEI